MNRVGAPAVPVTALALEDDDQRSSHRKDGKCLLRGRATSLNSVFIESPNGAFEAGLVARLFGPVSGVVSRRIGMIVVVLSVPRSCGRKSGVLGGWKS
jgi:hypothetical protein